MPLQKKRDLCALKEADKTRRAVKKRAEAAAKEQRKMNVQTEKRSRKRSKTNISDTVRSGVGKENFVRDGNKGSDGLAGLTTLADAALSQSHTESVF